MFDPENPKQPVMIEDFPVAAESICGLMPRLMARLRSSQTLRGGLFQADFLATLSGELMVTLIYHRQLGTVWELAARDLAADLDIQVIGRSRGQKVVLDRDWLLEEFELNGRHLRYQQVEGSFTQPNGGVNRQMLGWACQQAARVGRRPAGTLLRQRQFHDGAGAAVRQGAGHRGQQVVGACRAVQHGRQRGWQSGAGARVQRGDRRRAGGPDGAQAHEGHRPRQLPLLDAVRRPAAQRAGCRDARIRRRLRQHPVHLLQPADPAGKRRRPAGHASW